MQTAEASTGTSRAGALLCRQRRTETKTMTGQPHRAAFWWEAVRHEHGCNSGAETPAAKCMPCGQTSWLSVRPTGCSPRQAKAAGSSGGCSFHSRDPKDSQGGLWVMWGIRGGYDPYLRRFAEIARHDDPGLPGRLG